MNNNLLLKHKVNLPPQYISFMLYLHPDYALVNDLNNFDNVTKNGIIYTGSVSDQTVSLISSLTSNWIIISNKVYDTDLSSNEGLIKHLLPIHYAKIKKRLKPNEIPVYNTVTYDNLLDQIKLSLITNNDIVGNDNDDQSVYPLFAAIVSTPDTLSRIFFETVNPNNVSMVTSSVLKFLNRVIINDLSSQSVNYNRLILQSNRRYGKHIKQAILNFIKSKANKEISLYNLLFYLNKAR